MDKRSIEDLAIFGGRPGVPQPLHVNRPSPGNVAGFYENVASAFHNKVFTNNGPLVRDLEQRLCSDLRVDNCILTSSGTSALTLLIRALDLEGEVIIPDFTFISTAHALLWAGLRPVFCDIDPRTWTLDVDASAELISERTSAVIGTHVWGRACDIAGLERLCADNGIHLLFDAAHAFGATYRGAPIGRFGTAEVFSFHATKVFQTFEGGAITTNDGALADRLRRMRNFGFSDYDRVEMLGTNAKMSEVHAAMGLANLACIESTIERGRLVKERYGQCLGDVPGLTMYPHPSAERSNHHYVVADVSEAEFGLSRDALVTVLHHENVFARRYFYPGCHLAEPYRSLYPDAGAGLSHSRRIANRVVLFPGGAGIEDDDVARVCTLVRFLAANAARIAPLLAERSDRS